MNLFVDQPHFCLFKHLHSQIWKLPGNSHVTWQPQWYIHSYFQHIRKHHKLYMWFCGFCCSSRVFPESFTILLSRFVIMNAVLSVSCFGEHLKFFKKNSKLLTFLRNTFFGCAKFHNSEPAFWRGWNIGNVVSSMALFSPFLSITSHSL